MTKGTTSIHVAICAAKYCLLYIRRLCLLYTQKVTHLELMLEEIANFCPVISRNTIIKSSTSVQSIWQSIRMHYGFQSSGSHLIDYADIRLEADERPEDLFLCLVAFVEDSLICKTGAILHHGALPEEDEEMSPTLENLIVLN